MTRELAVIDDNTDLVNASWDALSIETRKAYRSDLDQFLKFCNKDFRNVTPVDVSNYIKHLRGRGLKNSTINRKIAALSKTFSIHVQIGRMMKNPVSLVRAMQKTNYKTQRNVKSNLKIELLKKAIQKPVGLRDIGTVLIIKFLAKTGCRITETLTAKRSDISPHSKKSDRILIFGKGQKERFVYLDKKLKKEIYKYFKNEKDLLFSSEGGVRMHRAYAYRLIVDYFKKTIDMHVNPHRLRHFFATHKIDVEKMNIKSVSKHLGHSDTSTTLNMYVDTALDEQQAEVDL